jgi:hypothetical protein
MVVVTFVLVGLGVLLIVTGVIVSLIDWNRRNRPKRVEGKVVTDATGLPETLTGLAKLADALKGHALGMQLVMLGIVVLIIGGIFGGVAQLK